MKTRRNCTPIFVAEAVILIFCSVFSSQTVAYGDAQSLYEQGLKFLDNDDYDKAIECLEKAIEEMPKVPQIHNALGIVLLKKTSSLKSAKNAFQKAIDLDPHYGEPYFNMGTYYAGSANDPVLAAEQFEKAIKSDPKFSKAYMALGWIYMQKEDSKRAVENFQKAVDLDPHFAEAQYGLGLAQVTSKNNAMALKPITALREMGRFDLAQAVETMLKGEDSSLKEPSKSEEPLEITAVR